MATKSKKGERSVEESFLQLEEMIKQLESDTITLEDSFSTYQKGMKLIQECNDTIDKVEKQVLVLNGEGGVDEF
ncbi:MAG: exodeoxyribonuclease VII small subunit [Eubacteriales bacterium]